MFLKVPSSSIIETKPKEHARKIGVGGELGAALNMCFRGLLCKVLNDSLIVDTHFVNK